MSDFKITEEQRGALDAFETGGNMVISAYAGCLAADTLININRGGKGHTSTIENIARQVAGNPVMTRMLNGKMIVQGAKKWDMSIPTMAACADDKIIRLGKLDDAWFAGEKTTYTLATESGKMIRATAQHPFLTRVGWCALGDLPLGEHVAVNTGRKDGSTTQAKAQYLCRNTRFHPNQVWNGYTTNVYKVPTHRLTVEADLNGLSLNDFLDVVRFDEEGSRCLIFLPADTHVHHIDENHRNNDLSNLQVMTISEHLRLHGDGASGDNVLWQVGYEQITWIQEYGIEPTYDIGMAAEPHNFLANGFVVHNSGKTSTLKLLADESPRTTRLLFLAYNRSIADDAGKKFPANTACRTAHSIAYGAVGRKYRNKLDAPKMWPSDMAKAMGIYQSLDVSDLVPAKLAAWTLARHVIDTVKRFCYSADTEINAQHVPFIPGVNMDTLKSYIVPIARRAWEDLTLVDGGNLAWNGAQDIYLKLWAMSEPKLPADVVMLDEAQDANPCITKVVADHNGQKVMVGDGNQQIYAWRGAVDAMQTFSADHRVSLTQSFRFGDAIAQEANVWLRKLGNELPLRGFDQIASTVGPVDTPNAILCRTNAQVVAEAVQRQDRGQKVAIVGGTGEIKKIAESATKLQTGRSASHPDLMAFKSWQDVRDFVAQEEGGSLKMIVRMIDTYGADKVIDVANNAVSEDRADVILSTAHKAKGREWGTVKIGSDFQEPEHGQPLQRSEAMLLYVAVTRAKLILDNSAIMWAHGERRGPVSQTD